MTASPPARKYDPNWEPQTHTCLTWAGEVVTLTVGAEDTCVLSVRGCRVWQVLDRLWGVGWPPPLCRPAPLLTVATQLSLVLYQTCVNSLILQFQCTSTNKTPVPTNEISHSVLPARWGAAPHSPPPPSRCGWRRRPARPPVWSCRANLSWSQARIYHSRATPPSVIVNIILALVLSTHSPNCWRPSWQRTFCWSPSDWSSSRSLVPASTVRHHNRRSLEILSLSFSYFLFTKREIYLPMMDLFGILLLVDISNSMGFVQL